MRARCWLLIAAFLVASPAAAQEDAGVSAAPEPERALPVVRVGTPEVTAGYDVARVRRAATRGLEELRRCVDGLRHAGALHVHFTLDARGRAVSARVPELQRGLDVEAQLFAHCLTNAVERWRLAPPDVAPVEVVLPLRVRDPEGASGYSRRVSLPEGRVRVGPPAVQGRLRGAQVRSVVQRHVAEVRFCYERELLNRPDLAGRLTIRFVVAPAGSVASSALVITTVAHPEVEQCIVHAVRRWAFPPPSEGIAVVDLPLTLEPRPPRREPRGPRGR